MGGQRNYRLFSLSSLAVYREATGKERRDTAAIG